MQWGHGENNAVASIINSSSECKSVILTCVRVYYLERLGMSAVSSLQLLFPLYFVSLFQ